MPTVGVVGAGLIGRAWANVFARAGWDVRLWDPDKDALAAAPRLIEEALHDVARHGLAKDAAAAARRITPAASLEEAVQDVAFVQENGPERVEVKLEVFARAGCGSTPVGHSRLVLVGHRRLALHGEIEGPRALPDRASGQPAARGADRGAVRRTVDIGGHHRSARAPSTRASARCPSR